MSDQNLFKTLTTLHLTQEEKRFMQQNVLLHARERGILSPLTSLFVFSRSFVSVTAMALVLLVGTTVVHGAERSIPGDALYAMKRGVNERVHLAIERQVRGHSHNLTKQKLDSKQNLLTDASKRFKRLLSKKTLKISLTVQVSEKKCKSFRYLLRRLRSL